MAAAIVNNSAESRTILTKRTICLLESNLMHQGRRECEWSRNKEADFVLQTSEDAQRFSQSCLTEVWLTPIDRPNNQNEKDWVLTRG